MWTFGENNYDFKVKYLKSNELSWKLGVGGGGGSYD